MNGIDVIAEPTEPEALLSVRHLTVEFPAPDGRTVHAVSDVSFDVAPGETLGLVGESGCGKSTTGRAIMQLPKPTSGSVRLNGRELTEASGQELRRVRTELQMVLQDPVSSLNPRRTVRDLVAHGLEIWRKDLSSNGREEVVTEMLEAVGLEPAAVLDRKPKQFSGGQCQRICIARALVLNPKVLICDESVSALDVSVQAQILNLIKDLKQQYGLTMIFISHDLSVVRLVSDRVAVMYLGRVCEIGEVDEIFDAPRHPYTRTLLASIPEMDTGEPLPGEQHEMPSPLDPPSGCRFRTRCPHAQAVCASEEPQLERVGDNHEVACHFHEELFGEDVRGIADGLGHHPVDRATSSGPEVVQP